jgi:integrase
MAGKKGRRRRFGTVRQLPSGRWQARYTGPDGLKRPAPRTFATETDANVWLTVTEAAIVQGNWVDPDAGRIPLGVYPAKWIAERPGLAPRTTALYEGLLRLHIEPTLGAVDLVDLTPARVRAWRKDLLESGVGETTVAKCYRLLRSVLNTAVDDELIRRNPCRIKGAGAEKSGERPVATPEQVLALAAAMPARWRALVLLAATTSLRWGELMALTRADVDLEHGTVRVVNAVAEVNGKIVVGSPKSAAGRRTVAVPESVVAVLSEHVASFSEAGARGRVFVGVRGRTLRRTNFQPLWRKGVEAAGLPAGFRVHDLRHTGNTWAAATGANLRQLMERMGHSSTRAALIYLHAAKDGDRAIATGIDRHLAGSNDVEHQDDGGDRG